MEDRVSAHEVEVERLDRNASADYLQRVMGSPMNDKAWGALAEAQRQHARKAEEEAVADYEKRWRAVERLGKKRRDLGVEIDVALENLVNTVNELVDVSLAMHSQVPVKTVGVTHTKLSRAAIEGSV